MTEPQNLLAEYVQTGSDAAFRELVARYVGLVYSSAMRLVDGDAHRAEDVAQTVFVDLARMAKTIPQDVMLGGWLHRHTCFVAMNIIRSERRRASREKEAVEMNALQDHSDANFSHVAPLLDEAINELGETDRRAILLRFFEQHDFRSVGEAIGANEDAARMRVTRALEKLESLLKHRGVTTSATVLSLVLSANAVQAAPVGILATISSAVSLTANVVQTSTAVAATKSIAMTTLQKTLITSALIVATSVGLYEGVQVSKLREQNRTSLQQQVPLIERVQQLQREKEEALNQVSRLANEVERVKVNSTELLKMRARVAKLSEASSDSSAKLQSENDELKMEINALKGRWYNVTNSPQFSIPYLAKDNWGIRGNGDPLEMFISAAAALRDGDDAKLAALIPAGNKIVSSLLSRERWEDVKGIQVVGTDYSTSNGQETATLNTILINKRNIPSTAGNPPALEELIDSHPEMRRWHFSKSEIGWEIIGAD